MRAAAGAIRRARARARAHHEIAGDGLERGSTQRYQVCVMMHLTHAWQRASSAARVRLGAMRAAAGAISSARARARAHVEFDDFRELGQLQGLQRWIKPTLTHA